MSARLKRFIATDATVIFLLGLGILVRGLSYTSWLRPPAKGTHPAETVFTMPTWSFVWVIVGAFCIAGAFARRSWIATAAFALGVGLNIAWGCSFLFSTVLGDSPRGWVQAINYFIVVLLALWGVWRGQAGEIRIKEG